MSAERAVLEAESGQPLVLLAGALADVERRAAEAEADLAAEMRLESQGRNTVNARVLAAAMGRLSGFRKKLVAKNVTVRAGLAVPALIGSLGRAADGLNEAATAMDEVTGR